MKIIKIILAIGCMAILGFLINWTFFPDESPYWTGFGSSKIDPSIKPSKNLWDWLDLVLIPLILGIAGWWLATLGKKVEQNSLQERHQNENINRYLDLMTNLLLKEGLKADPENEIVSAIARTHSIRLLRESDNNRKAVVLQFLNESGLIEVDPIVDLNGGDIRHANLEGIVLRGVSIKGAYFLNCNLKNSKLNNSDFTGSNFNFADVTDATFENTNLTYANFIGAKVINCDLRTSNLNGTDFSNADLSGSKITKAQDEIIKKENVKNLIISE